MAFIIAGVLAIVAGIAHGVLSERLVVLKIAFPSSRLKTITRGIFQVSAAAWIAAGVLFIFLARTGETELAAPIIYSQAAVLGLAAAVNFIATRGRHFGWLLLAPSAVLAIYGLLALE